MLCGRPAYTPARLQSEIKVTVVRDANLGYCISVTTAMSLASSRPQGVYHDAVKDLSPMQTELRCWFLCRHLAIVSGSARYVR